MLFYFLFLTIHILFVFAAHQSYGLLVIDPAIDKVVNTVTMECVNKIAYPDLREEKKGVGIGSVVVAKDGSLWMSVAKNIQGSGATLPYLVRVDPETLATEAVEIPADFYSPANSWYSWTPDGFCSSHTENVLYWNGGPNSWFSNTKIYRFDIDSRTVSLIIDLDKEAEEQGLDNASRWKVYGCSMRPHPQTGNLYISMLHHFQINDYILRKYSPIGEKLAEYPMIANYWFPSLPVFPTNPEASGIGEITDTENCNAGPEYYDINGRPVENPTLPSIYIRRAGSASSKFIIR